jgi:PAS domain-containing protein
MQDWFREVLLLEISSIISLMLIIYAIRHKDAPGALSFAALMLCALIWSFGYALEIASGELTAKVFWLNVQQIGIFGSSIAWLVMALQFSGHAGWLNKKLLIPLSIFPALAVLLIWTNELHHFMRLDVYIETAGQLSVVKIVKTPLSLMFIIYSYLLLILSLYFLISSARRALSPYREQRIVFSVSLLLPMATMLIDLVGLNPFAPFGPTSITFILSGLLIAWSFYRYQLFHIWPIARDKLIDELQNGVIVTDASGKITDLNPASRTILKQILNEDAPLDAIDYSLALFITSWPGWYKSYTEQKEHQVIEISLPDNIYYEVRISLLKNPRGLLIGHLTVMHEITQAKQTEKELFRQATTDYLTGIYNRRHFMELSEREYLISVRYQKPLSLIMIDIDFFKQVNDTYGHKGGDRF